MWKNIQRYEGMNKSCEYERERPVGVCPRAQAEQQLVQQPAPQSITKFNANCDARGGTK